MKSLQTVQKIAKVLKVLTTIGAWFAFIGAAFCLVAIGVLFGVDRNLISLEFLERFMTGQALYGDAFRFETAADLVVCLGNGILCACAARYLSNELMDGTPFTFSGAKELKSLGIKTIVYPIVTVVIASVICEFGHVEPSFTNALESGLGIGLILLSFVFRYGADLEKIAEQQEED